MNIAIIILLILSVLLFIVSFFQKDGKEQLEMEYEELAMSLLQDQHNMKKRIGRLEEEMMLESQIARPLANTKENQHAAGVHEIVKNQVLSLYQQGVDVQQISKQSALSVNTVTQIIQDGNRGKQTK